jgi:hypothetical protein
MSNPLKGIGKVFKKVLKVAKIVVPIALAAAAVVFTGGAALGVLPTFAGAIGGVVGGLGLSAGAATMLTGAIAGAGFGAALGGAAGLAGGKNVLKAMQSGALVGGITGGLMPGMVPGVSKVATGFANAAQLSTMANAPAGGLLSGLGQTATGIAAPAAPAVGASGVDFIQGAKLPGIAPPAGAPAVGTGIDTATRSASFLGASSAPASTLSSAVPAIPTGGGGLLSNPLLASQLIGGVSSALAPNEAKQTAKARADAEQEMGYYAYGGGDSNGKKAGGLLAGVYSSNPNPFGAKPYAPAPTFEPTYTPRTTRWQWDPVKSTIVEVPA